METEIERELDFNVQSNSLGKIGAKHNTEHQICTTVEKYLGRSKNLIFQLFQLKTPRERERDRETETETERDRERQRQRDSDRDRERPRERQRAFLYNVYKYIPAYTYSHSRVQSDNKCEDMEFTSFWL